MGRAYVVLTTSMTNKTFSIYKIVAVVALAVVTSVSVRYSNWYLPVVCIVAVWTFLHILRSKVKEVMTDERDRTVAGKAAGLAIQAYTLLSVIAGIVLYIAGKGDTVLFTAGNVLLYSACFLMFLHTVLFKVYKKRT